MLTGLGITGLIYILVSITAIALVPAGELGQGEAPLTKVVAAGAPNIPIGDIFPLIAMFAVANSALINMMMASRLLYGMAKQQVLPPVLGRVLEGRRTPWVAILFTTAIAVGLLIYVGSLDQRRQRDQPARRHHRAAAARGVHRGQHLLPGAAAGSRRAPALPRSDGAADHRRALLRVPGHAADRPQPAAVHDRRRCCSPSASCSG